MTLTPEALDALLRWVTAQRWYPAKGEPDAVVRLLETTDLPDPLHEAHVAVAYVAVERPGSTTSVLQVPVVATTQTPDTGVIHRTRRGCLVDGPHHPAFVRAWLAAAQVPADDVEGTRVLGGEQSNTSVLVPLAPDPGILKVFRVLADGPNPEVEVAVALARTGWTGVPAPLGWLEGSWTTPEGGTATGHLGVLARFVPGAEDGFERTCARAAAGDVEGTDVRTLGATVAAMHAALAQALPTPDDRDDDGRRADLQAGLRQRARWAQEEVAVLRHFADGIDAVIGGLGDLEHVPDTQRVHGDLHLGQVLHAGAPGAWFVLDFEGEPLRPLAERTRPDHALRDLAGMLRSVDYAAAVGGATDPTWVQRVRAELTAGYADAAVTGDPATTRALLRALELDKALYEVVYEHHNRPDWLPIPLEGVRRLTEEDMMSPRDDVTPEVPAEPHEPADPHQPADPHEPGRAVAAAPFSVPADLLARVARGEHFAPHDVLGPHVRDGVVTIRTTRHHATAVTVVTADTRVTAHHEQDGIWVAALAGDAVPDYRLEVTYDDDVVTVDDPYRFLPTLGEVDQHLVREGRHERLWDVLGAHVRRYPSALGDVVGTSFAVWAPNARGARVLGDFNGWDGSGSSMRSIGSSGVWEVFLPGVLPGERYKLEIGYADGTWHAKADPMARATEVPPSTASVVTESSYDWADDEWMTERATRDPHKAPMSVYEVHLGSWRQGLGYRELAEQLTEYVTWMGFTHVELLPVAEHPFGGSWGYQVTSYYAPTSRFGSPDDFRYLVDTLHRAGVGVILDWVPAHFPKDAWALARFDGTPLYEHPDPMRGEQQDWGTYVFDFGRNEVRNFLVANAVYWLSEFHIDGLRVDAVASMLYLDYSREAGQWRPNVRGGRENLEAIQFLQETNATAYRTNPGILMIAEESTAWPGVTAATSHGGLGFGLKWNMGWMNDTLRYVAEEPVNRRYHHGELTFSLVYAFTEQFVLPLSHDEVVHGKGSLLRKMPGDRWQQLAGLRALFAYMWSHPGKNLLFMGSEFGQDAEWAEGRSLDWWQGDTPEHAGVRLLLRDLNQVYRDHPALWADDFSPAGFSWLEAGDGDHNAISYLRQGEGQTMAVVVNFAGTPHEGYRLPLPHGGDWLEVLNTDAESYGGSGVGNLGRVSAEEVPLAGRSHSVALRVPPLGAVFLTPAPAEPTP